MAPVTPPLTYPMVHENVAPATLLERLIKITSPEHVIWVDTGITIGVGLTVTVMQLLKTVTPDVENVAFL